MSNSPCVLQAIKIADGGRQNAESAKPGEGDGGLAFATCCTSSRSRTVKPGRRNAERTMVSLRSRRAARHQDRAEQAEQDGVGSADRGRRFWCWSGRRWAGPGWDVDRVRPSGVGCGAVIRFGGVMTNVILGWLRRCAPTHRRTTNRSQEQEGINDIRPEAGWRAGLDSRAECRPVPARGPVRRGQGGGWAAPVDGRGLAHPPGLPNRLRVGRGRGRVGAFCCRGRGVASPM